MRIARTLTDSPIHAGIWCTDHGIVVAFKGRATVANRNRLDAAGCRAVGTALIEAADYLDGHTPAALVSIEGDVSSDHWCTPDCVDPDTWDAACPLNAGVERPGPAGGAAS